MNFINMARDTNLPIRITFMDASDKTIVTRYGFISSIKSYSFIFVYLSDTDHQSVSTTIRVRHVISYMNESNKIILDAKNEYQYIDSDREEKDDGDNGDNDDDVDVL